MTKAKRQILSDLKLVDVVIEVLDARAPYSTRNPDIGRMTEGRKRLIILNKSDLADPERTEQWIRRIREKGDEAIAMDSRSRDASGSIRQALTRLGDGKRERDRKRGILIDRPLKCLVTGIPNVGKSTLINTLAGRASAKTGDKPGVTRGNQWLTISDGLMLLDTPGVLWPKFSDEQAAVNLALIGSINDSVLNTEELAVKLIAYLDAVYPAALMERYDLKEEAVEERLTAMEEVPLGVDRRALAVFGLIARNRCALKKGGEPDYERTSKLMLTDLRSGRLGRITLETKVIY